MSFFKIKKLENYELAARDLYKIFTKYSLKEWEIIKLLGILLKNVGGSFKDTTELDPIKILDKAAKSEATPGEMLIVAGDEVLAMLELHYDLEKIEREEANKKEI